jgi:hypothetical protein
MYGIFTGIRKGMYRRRMQQQFDNEEMQPQFYNNEKR